MSTFDRSPGLNWSGLDLPTTLPTGDPSWAILVRDIVGWWNGAPEVSEPIEHWSGDGQVETKPRLGARTVEVTGVIHAKPGSMVQAWDALRQRKRGTFRVDERDMGLAKLSSAVRTDLKFTHFTEILSGFSLFLRMADPIRYGASSRTLTNGSQSIPNAGDLDASPTLTLTGPHGAVTIQHPGGTYTFAALSSGTRVLDFRNGDVWNGQSRVFGAEAGARPVVRDGGSTWTVSGLGSGSATLTRFEAWS